jgi:hypothetical protein
MPFFKISVGTGDNVRELKPAEVSTLLSKLEGQMNGRAAQIH